MAPRKWSVSRAKWGQEEEESQSAKEVREEEEISKQKKKTADHVLFHEFIVWSREWEEEEQERAKEEEDNLKSLSHSLHHHHRRRSFEVCVCMCLGLVVGGVGGRWEELSTAHDKVKLIRQPLKRDTHSHTSQIYKACDQVIKHFQLTFGKKWQRKWMKRRRNGTEQEREKERKLFLVFSTNPVNGPLYCYKIFTRRDCQTSALLAHQRQQY